VVEVRKAAVGVRAVEDLGVDRVGALEVAGG
jgi:hypothetical protein